MIELTTPWNCSGSPAASKWPVGNFAVLEHCALQCPGLLQAKQEIGLACATLVWTMGIGLPLHWLAGAAATGVNAEGSLLLLAGLYFNRSLCLTWVRALASALIIFVSSSESAVRSFRLYSQINDHPKSDFSAKRMCFYLFNNNFPPLSSEAWPLPNWREERWPFSPLQWYGVTDFRLNLLWSSLPLSLKRWGSSNFLWGENLRCSLVNAWTRLRSRRAFTSKTLEGSRFSFH